MTTARPTPAELAGVQDELRKPFSRAGKLRLGVEILDSYLRVRWWLLRRDLPDVVAAVRGGEQTPPSEVELSQQATGYRLGRVVGRTLSKLPADSRCLVRSLVLSRLLARRGIQATLVIGVKPGPKFEAHAWVESGGVALLPPGEMDRGRLLEL